MDHVAFRKLLFFKNMDLDSALDKNECLSLGELCLIKLMCLEVQGEP